MVAGSLYNAFNHHPAVRNESAISSPLHNARLPYFHIVSGGGKEPDRRSDNPYCVLVSACFADGTFRSALQHGDVVRARDRSAYLQSLPVCVIAIPKRD